MISYLLEVVLLSRFISLRLPPTSKVYLCWHQVKVRHPSLHWVLYCVDNSNRVHIHNLHANQHITYIFILLLVQFLMCFECRRNLLFLKCIWINSIYKKWFCIKLYTQLIQYDIFKNRKIFFIQLDLTSLENVIEYCDGM